VQPGTTVPALDAGASDEVYPLTGSAKWIHDLIGVVVGGLALIALLARGFVATRRALICVWVRIAYARAYTEITAYGFSTRGLSGTKRAAWADVSAIKVSTVNGTSGVKVWVSGRRTAIVLGAPTRSPIMGNPDFSGEVQRIRAAWNQARAAVEPS
jgi:hypothetical protein